MSSLSGDSRQDTTIDPAKSSINDSKVGDKVHKLNVSSGISRHVAIFATSNNVFTNTNHVVFINIAGNISGDSRRDTDNTTVKIQFNALNVDKIEIELIIYLEIPDAVNFLNQIGNEKQSRETIF